MSAALTPRGLIGLEILTALSYISFMACLVATYYNPDILNKGLWVLISFATVCNFYVGSALERGWRHMRTQQRLGSNGTGGI